MDRTILRGIVGSTAHGLNTTTSDLDRLGIFVSPTLEVAGLDWHSSRESHVNQGPGHDDVAEHEIGKYIRLALRANPTVTELLWLDDDLYETMTDEGYDVLQARKNFLSKKYVRDAYLGYAIAQRQKLLGKYIFKPKYARHAVRLARQGALAVVTDNVKVRVDDPEWFHSVLGNDVDLESALRIVDEELSTARKLIEKYESRSPLPEVPDPEPARKLLRSIRKVNL